MVLVLNSKFALLSTQLYIYRRSEFGILNSLYIPKSTLEGEQSKHLSKREYNDVKLRYNL
jgi:hypothetical protein